ncbi:MAG: 4Fe-4S binding protein [Chloroflexi bacterium]|nr:4Fe-4S binding protein [Chloroflexota bacterium]
MPQYALMVDLERCFGCRSCEAACKQTNHLGYYGFRNRVVWITPTQPNERLHFITTMCQQCERPACLRACDSFPKAIYKNESDGAVLIDTSVCVGCQKCVEACPYNCMGFDPRVRKAVKCTMCIDRRELGLQPACVSVCPGRALTYGIKEELLAQAAKEGRQVRNIDHFAQNPSTIYLEPLRRNGDGSIHTFPGIVVAVK